MRTPSIYIDENVTVPATSRCEKYHNCLTCPEKVCVEDLNTEKYQVISNLKMVRAAAGSKGGKAKRKYTPEQWNSLIERLKNMQLKRWGKKGHESEKTI